METNVVFPGLEGAWTEILPKIRDVKIVPGDFKAVTTCRWSHRSGDHQQLFQKVSRITIPKKGHPKVTSRIARLYKWSCPFFGGAGFANAYITYQKGEGCMPPPGFCLGDLDWIFWRCTKTTKSKLACKSLVFLQTFTGSDWFSGRQRVYDLPWFFFNPKESIRKPTNHELVFWEKRDVFCVFQLNPRSPKNTDISYPNINEEIGKRISI